jgi:muramidase (phage lysozyme)
MAGSWDDYIAMIAPGLAAGPPPSPVPPPRSLLSPEDLPSDPAAAPASQVTPPAARLPASTMTKAGIPLGDLRELIKSSESGEFGGYDALAWHPNYQPNAMSRPLDPAGFPQWPGSSATGKGSHGAGAYQFEPELWGEFAPGLGIKDFSPESQDRVADAAIMRYGTFPWKTNQTLQAAIRQYKATGKLPGNLVTAANQ